MWAIKQLQAKDSELLVRDARDYALVKGLVLRYGESPHKNYVRQLPVTLLPSPFPRKLYQNCLDIQPAINELMLKIANDPQYIEDSLASVVKVDDFTKNLLDVNRSILREGRSQPIISCINRSDYMLDYSQDSSSNPFQIKQVEVNAIASSMSAHSYNTQLMHKYLVDKYGLKLPGIHYPSNDGVSMIAEALITAHDAYGKADAYILVITESRILNIGDIFQIELLIYENRPDIKIVSRRFSDLPDSVELGPNKELFVDGNKEVSVVYYRACYDPSHYNFPSAWDLRFLLERSRAIKCPSINFHLSGVKKFQQLLNSASDLERYLEPGAASQLSQMFCKFWSLDADTESGSLGYEFGLKQNKNLVLKPQREGGGHNIYGDDIAPFLKDLTNSSDRSQYILMQLINCPKEYNWLLLPDDKPEEDKNKLDNAELLLSELGIFGSVLANGSNVLSNQKAGYLVRSKRHGTNEGGVATGYAGISSLFLIDDDRTNNLAFNDYFSL